MIKTFTIEPGQRLTEEQLKEVEEPCGRLSSLTKIARNYRLQ